jgi:acetyl-CoA acetyltransferase
VYREIVIAAAIRTPFGRLGGALKEFDYYDLGERFMPRPDLKQKVYAEHLGTKA